MGTANGHGFTCLVHKIEAKNKNSKYHDIIHDRTKATTEQLLREISAREEWNDLFCWIRRKDGSGKIVSSSVVLVCHATYHQGISDLRVDTAHTEWQAFLSSQVTKNVGEF